MQLPDGLLEDGEIATIGQRTTFLPEEQDRSPLEDPMIEHDANTFLGWAPTTADKLGVRTYTDGTGKTLQVMNVNRWSIESALGPDLLYYHVQRRSFVLVQYKRMTREGSHWRYRVDDGFHKQLVAMRELDEKCLKAGSDQRFRLLATPSFVKVCRLDNLDIDSLSMVSGMCMPREQVEAHLARQDGASLFDYDNITDYMTSTLFAELVAHGYLGSSGKASDLVKHEISRCLNRTGSLVVGALSDESGRRPGGPRAPASRLR